MLCLQEVLSHDFCHMTLCLSNVARFGYRLQEQILLLNGTPAQKEIPRRKHVQNTATKVIWQRVLFLENVEERLSCIFMYIMYNNSSTEVTKI